LSRLYSLRFALLFGGLGLLYRLFGGAGNATFGAGWYAQFLK
jgi:hypothetical protein